MMKSRTTLLVGLSVACSEYELKGHEDPIPGDDTSIPTIETGTVDTGSVDTDIIDSGVVEPPVDECGERLFEGEPLDLVDECYVEEVEGTWTPIREWNKSSFSVDSGSNNVMMTPIVASITDDNGDGLINDDDTPDILFVTFGSYGTLRAVSGDGGTEILNIVGEQLQGQGALAAGDIDGDGIVEIIAMTSTGVKAFEHDGTLKWQANTIAAIYGISDAPSIADMDGDGTPEIIVGKAILSNTGAFLGVGSYGRGGVSSNVGTTSFAVDLDGDGQQEVVVGNALYDINGTALCYNGENDGYVAVGDFDGDGDGEVVVSGGARVRLQGNHVDGNCDVWWDVAIPGAGSAYYGGMPTVADFDGDGEPEIGVAANSSYTVFDTDGSIMWTQTTQDSSSGNTGSSVFDFEGDGVAEVVYADETRLWVFSGIDGTVKLESTAHNNGTWTEYPVIADVDGDGAAEIVVAHTWGPYGISVFGDADDSWRSGRRIWNQHAYSITNVNDDGTIPAVPDQNWLTYNNFRSGDLISGQGGVFPDLIATIDDVCALECDEGRVLVWARVGNQGYEDVADVEVQLIAEGPDGDVILATETVALIESGVMNDMIIFDVLGLDPAVQIDDLRLEIDGGDSSSDGLFEECDEENNTASWGDTVCTP
jgi:hypothetical protein